MHNTLTGMSVS